MVYLRHIAISTLGCCLLGFQHEPEDTEPLGTESTQAQVTEPEGTGEEVSFVETKLTASDAAKGDFFGCSVAMSGNTAIIGAVGNDDGGDWSGAAYLFDVMGNQLFKLTPCDAAADDQFGYSVAISDNRAIVGTYRSGSAYLFDVLTGKELFKLTPSDTAAGDLFGSSVAINGNTTIVGACWDDDGGDDSGSAYLFDVITGNQLFKLTASDAAAGDFFGRSVAISGNTAIVGACVDDDLGDHPGSAYLFDVTTGNQLFKLTRSDVVECDFFGWSVAISGNAAIVGAYRDDGSYGAAYLFDVTTGNQIFKLTASDAAAGDFFGWSVAISGNTAIIGGDNSGSAYLFDVATGNQLSKLTASDAAAGDQFGDSVAISGNTALVGASYDDDGGSLSGSAYVFTP